MSQLDNEFDGIDEGEYMLKLVENAPTAATLLVKISNGLLFKGFVVGAQHCKSTGVSLNVDEVNMMLDMKYVDWDNFHTGILESIFYNRGSNKSNSRTRSTQHSNKKMELMTKLHKVYPSHLEKEWSGHKKETWRSGVDALAVEFIRELENSVVKGEGDLLKEIEKILSEKWAPIDDEHSKTIYYICGATLYMVQNRSKDNKEQYQHEYELLLNNASTTKEDAMSGNLPYERGCGY